MRYSAAVLLLAGSVNGYIMVTNGLSSHLAPATARLSNSIMYDSDQTAKFRFGTGSVRPVSLGGTGLNVNQNVTSFSKEDFRFGTGRVVPVALGGNGLKGEKVMASGDDDFRFGTGRVDPVPLGGA